MNRLVWRWVGVAALVMAVGCGTDEATSAHVEALIPSGSNATFVSSTIPTSMFPGERLDVSVTMRNTGTADPANTWTLSSPQYAFFRTGATSFGVSYDVLEATTTTGNTTTFNFVLTAPTTPGTYTFQGQMGAVGTLTRFGDVVSIGSINVSSSNPRRWGCTFVAGSSTIPSTMGPGENRSITVAVQNSGTATWTPASSFFLYSRDSPLGLWNNINRQLTSPVAPGATATFSFAITAPTTPGTYNLRRQMFLNGTVGFFDTATPCVDASITVGGSAALNSSFVSNTLPATLAPGEVRSVTVTVQNTGTQNWATDGTFFLYSVNSPVGLYGTINDPMDAATNSGSNHTFTFNITAPAAGSYAQRWQMFRSGTGFFGPILNVPLTVSTSSTPSRNAAVSSQSIPSVMTAGEPAIFTITMQNTGSAAWTGSTFGIYSRNSPLSLWGVNQQFLGSAESVAAGATRTFTLSVTAPATPGTYSSSWQMIENGVAFFGATASFTPITVTLCGNGTVDAGEQCDDNNLTAGDGCSATCTVETISIDLATAGTPDRTLVQASTNHQLASVAIGDVTNDGVVEVIVADATHVVPTTGSARNAAGVVYGYTGGASFFTNASTTVPTSAAFRVLGATTNDRLGNATTGAFIGIGDVTGDGVSDLIVSAANADGVGDARTDAGETYILTGGAGLTGDIDLGATTPPAALAATIVGAAAGDKAILLAVGDLTGDSIADLVLGAPFADANGVDSGVVYIVTGGPSLTGTIDLSAPTVTVRQIVGETAGSSLGLAAAVGNFTGSSTNDLLIGNRHYTSGGLSRRGAAFAYAGPITANSTATPASATFSWLGLTQNDNFGCAVAIGNVVGTSAADVVIGAYQQRRGAQQVGAVDVWDGTNLSSASATVTFLGADAFDNAGTALSLGDMNGDGFLDIPVASGLADGPSNARSNAGEVVVYFGAAALSGTVDLLTTPGRVLVSGAAANDGAGLHPPGIAFRDIDGNGRADLCIGSFQGGATTGGRVDCIESTF